MFPSLPGWLRPAVLLSGCSEGGKRENAKKKKKFRHGAISQPVKINTGHLGFGRVTNKADGDVSGSSVFCARSSSRRSDGEVYISLRSVCGRLHRGRGNVSVLFRARSLVTRCVKLLRSVI